MWTMSSFGLGSQFWIAVSVFIVCAIRLWAVTIAVIATLPEVKRQLLPDVVVGFPRGALLPCDSDENRLGKTTLDASPTT